MEFRFGRVLSSLVQHLKQLNHPSLLDLGPTCGSNISYFIRLGCKVHADDYVTALLSSSSGRPKPKTGPQRAAAGRAAPAGSRRPRAGAPPVEHGSGKFQAVLCWDLFDYLPEDEALGVAHEIGRITADRGYVLALFGPARGLEVRLPLRFRIQAEGHVQAESIPGSSLRPHHVTNRHILQLFSDFEIAQTILLKNGVREMLLQKRAARKKPPSPPAMASLS
ncbi:MAG: hypothetical protein ACE5HD_10115 [Acidobacteriota bacterium]